MSVLQQSERDFQRAVIDLARRCGWMVAHFHDSRRQVRPGVFVGDEDASGFLDLVLCRELVLFSELKREKGRLTPKQRAWIAALERAGMNVRVWRPSDWPPIERELAAKERG